MPSPLPATSPQAIEAMRRRGIILAPYLDTRMVEDIYKVGAVQSSMARLYGDAQELCTCTT
jgi:hypothetical protein